MSARVLEFPVVPLTDVPARLRLLAEQIEDGEFGEVQNVAMAIEADGLIVPLSFGENWDESRAIGFFTRAAARLCSALDAVE